uniref:hypothetical protein n=1 Tax=Fulvivirga sp. TaxID=1931237 RepID=UPI00404A50F7
MPSVNCFVSKTLSKEVNFSKLVREWAETVGVAEADINFIVITDYHQFGQAFPVMIRLFLPSIWTKSEREKTLIALAKLIQLYFSITDQRTMYY